jgi:hypothetical protein
MSPLREVTMKSLWVDVRAARRLGNRGRGKEGHRTQSNRPQEPLGHLSCTHESCLPYVVPMSDAPYPVIDGHGSHRNTPSAAFPLDEA